MTAPPLPLTMTAVEIRDKGGPDVLVPVVVDVPTPGPGQILIKVAAAGVNRPDIHQRLGHYPPPPGASPLPGLEVAGTVAALGPDAKGWRVGDRAMALVNGGGYAAYCIADDDIAMRAPDNLDMIRAGGVSETLFTVWNNVFERGQLKAGDWLLVHGGTSGIGTTAIQMAKLWGAKVMVTAGSDAKCDAARALGADAVANYKTEDFVAVAKSATSGHGIDVTLDMVGGDYTDRNIIAAAEDGRIVQIATLNGAEAKINVSRLMVKRVTLTGSTLRPRTRTVKAGFAKAISQHMLPHLAAGRLTVVLDSTFPLVEAREAHRRMETSQHIGKIVLVV